MPNYAISAFGLNQVSITGPNPFLNQAGRNMAALNNSTITIAPTARSTLIEISDDDTHFHDVAQEVGNVSRLINTESFNGQTFPATAEIRNEYTYIIRPAGSTSSADNIRISVMRINGQISGFAFDKPVTPGVTYNVLSGGSDQPGHAYTGYAVVCFTAGTLIDTPTGATLVETLRPGDLVQTLDSGPQPITWILGRTIGGSGRNAPVLVPNGVLGNERDLLLSPQHRVMITHDRQEHLVPVKALVGTKGVTSLSSPSVRYLHLLCDGHQVIRAEGAAVETLLPGDMAMTALSPSDRSLLSEMIGPTPWEPARPLLRPGVWRRTQALTGSCRSLVAEPDGRRSIMHHA